MEQIHIRVQRPLFSQGIMVELGVPPIEILRPILEKPLTMPLFAMFDLKAVRWKSEHEIKYNEALARCGASVMPSLLSTMMLKYREEIKILHTCLKGTNRSVRWF
jgi:hypothetical protein